MQHTAGLQPHRGRGGVYEYFICLSRKIKRRYCSRTVTRLDKIEVGIAVVYRRFQIGQQRVAAIRQAVRTEIALERADAETTQVRARERLGQVKDDSPANWPRPSSSFERLPRPSMTWTTRLSRH
ncbi:MAG TPA: hypothetical protein VGR06_04835 [Actinophytocola sp.]|uniref:hypothetical protein n=1 Tax=Actinophytocola sp. TaxID=1872138 RepID=UPI002E0937BA|nr:hypothetical protein [Actinophytocola sp.]